MYTLQKKEEFFMKRNKEHFRGCLIGWAVGDGLGAPIEFMSLEEHQR